jgi:type IV fimbrial biogenesis protein FimT
MNQAHITTGYSQLPVNANALRRGMSGFSLVEVLAVLTVMALLLSVGVPSLVSALNSVKLTSATNSFLAHLHFARSESIKRNGRVVMCKSSDGHSCNPAGGWEQGWIIVHDANNNGLADPDEEILLRQEALPAALRLSGNQSVARYVSFAPTGATKLAGGGFQAGTLTLCRESADGGDARQIVLNAVGRPRVQKVSVSTCG